MSVLIKGMKIPEYRDVFGDERGCVYLLMLTVNKDGTVFMQFNDVDGGFYRVKEIPTPHGRLIDADELKKNMRNYYPSIDHLCRSQHVVTKGDIDCAPTIIEAEVSE